MFISNDLIAKLNAVLMRRLYASTVLILSSLLALSAPNAIAAGQTDNESDESQLLEKLQDGSTLHVIIHLDIDYPSKQQRLNPRVKQVFHARIVRTQQNVLRKLSRIDSKLTSTAIRFQYIPAIAMKINKRMFKQLLRNPRVTAVTEDHELEHHLMDSAPLVGAPDVSYCTEGNYDYCAAEVCSEENGVCGEGEIVVIIDGGVEPTHEFYKSNLDDELGACFSRNDTNMTSLCPNGEESEIGAGAGTHCVVSPDGSTRTCAHGTAIAGIIAGNGVNAGKSFSGVAPYATIVSVNVGHLKTNKLPGLPPTYQFSTELNSVLQGLEYVYDLVQDDHPIAAVNISLGYESYYMYSEDCDADYPHLEYLIHQLTLEGVAVVVGSGNDGQLNKIRVPACISDAISVGATTKADVVADYSNSADILDVLAPGGEYASKRLDGPGIGTSAVGNTYANVSGTSYATPHVAAGFALLRGAAHPDLSVQHLLDDMKGTGKAVLDYRNNRWKPRMQIDAALKKHVQVPKHYNTIQEAIDNADDWTTISVAPGIYKEQIDFKGKEIRLIGSPSEPTQTVIDGTIESSAASRPTVIMSYGKIRGFTITHDDPHGHSAAIVVSGRNAQGELDPSINVSDTVIEDNIFTRNGSSMIAIEGQGEPLIQRNIFKDNGWCNGGSRLATHTDTDTDKTWTAVMSLPYWSNARIINNIFHNNSSCYAILVFNTEENFTSHDITYAGLRIVNNTFINNLIAINTFMTSAYNKYNSQVIINNLMLDNGIGVRYVYGSDVKDADTYSQYFFYNNNLVYGSREYNYELSGGMSSKGRVIDSWSKDDKRNNLVADPLLEEDYTLNENSPAIDAGISNVKNTRAPLSDFDNVPRPLDGNGDGTEAHDIGASEYIYIPDGL